MDIVYVCRDGANPELLYSLRTLVNVPHDRVWVFGGAPSWLNTDTVEFKKRMQGGTPYSSTRGHIQAACSTSQVSDPFMLWNDDFFAMHHVGEMPIYHRGPLDALLVTNSALKTPWVKGMRDTAAAMERRGMLVGAMSYDVHLPLIVHKTQMLEALRWAKNVHTDAVHVRTLYGALAFNPLDGVEHPDPKMQRRSDPFPAGPWLSSSDHTFRSTVEPVLRYLFPNPSPYEKD